jgi:hypothetical protein
LDGMSHPSGNRAGSLILFFSEISTHHLKIFINRPFPVAAACLCVAARRQVT